MAKTLDHISNGRHILGIGAGWCERDYVEYGYEFGTAPRSPARPRPRAAGDQGALGKGLPPPVRNPIPILIGGGGEKVTLKLTAQHADLWNGWPARTCWPTSARVLHDWCAKVGRDPAAIEITVGVERADTEHEAVLDEFAAAGADQLILRFGEPWDFDYVRRLIAWRDSRNRDRE